MIADMVQEMGYSIAAEAGEFHEALRLAQCTWFDLAILDINMGGGLVFPVAEAIKARNIPFIFATGYTSTGFPKEFSDRPSLQKPFRFDTLARLIGTTLKSYRFDNETP